MTHTRTAAMFLAAVTGICGSAPAAPKNVILMVADGAGFNSFKAGAYAGTPVYLSTSGWTKVAVNTNSAGAAGGYVGAPYNASSMWSNPTYYLSGATDSAAAATAMYSGVKIYNGQINISTTGANLPTFFEQAAANGKSIGAISTVYFTDATPATVVSHTTSRSDYVTIANQMINQSQLKLIMGAGHAFYDNNAQPAAANYTRPGGQTMWDAITSPGGANGFSFIESKQQFQDLASGTTSATKLIGIAQVRDTLQEYRSTTGPGNLNSNVPDLATMTRGALNVLDRNAAGFSIMIEGGAVDWASHANRGAHMVEEQTDFNNAVQAVANYLDANTNGNNWTNTLVIVTADHETGGLWGAGSYTDVNGNGRYDAGTDTWNGYQTVDSATDLQYMTTSHTQSLVPLFAKGAGSEAIDDVLLGTDPQLVSGYGIGSWGFDGSYIDNTRIYPTMMVAVPEPTSLGTIAVGAILLLRRKAK